MASIPVTNDRYIAVTLYLSALANAATFKVACPVDGVIRRIQYAKNAAVDAANVLTSAIDGTAITGGGLTLAAADPTVMEAEPTAANECRRGQVLSVATDGGGSAGSGNIVFLIEQE